MLDPTQVPPVAPDELLARFVLFSRHFRSSDNSVKPEAFMPHPLTELSMTRHLQAAAAELWREGERVARLREARLYGRADVGVAAFTDQGLTIAAAPIAENPNHANARNWPAEKPDQKMKALLIAERSKYVPRPS